jgi:hypothetical protein
MTYGRLRKIGAAIIKGGCALESRKLPVFYSATIFPPNTRREFFNGIDPIPPIANDSFAAPGNAMGQQPSCVH